MSEAYLVKREAVWDPRGSAALEDVSPAFGGLRMTEAPVILREAAFASLSAGSGRPKDLAFRFSRLGRTRRRVAPLCGSQNDGTDFLFTLHEIRFTFILETSSDR